ncbi:hypothetical protein [Anoxybacter fermentans]|nr:hypothetical protein [Anoxybacter fermentans]
MKRLYLVSFIIIFVFISIGISIYSANTSKQAVKEKIIDLSTSIRSVVQNEDKLSTRNDF